MRKRDLIAAWRDCEPRVLGWTRRLRPVVRDSNTRARGSGLEGSAGKQRTGLGITCASSCTHPDKPLCSSYSFGYCGATSRGGRGRRSPAALVCHRCRACWASRHVLWPRSLCECGARLAQRRGISGCGTARATTGCISPTSCILFLVQSLGGIGQLITYFGARVTRGRVGSTYGRSRGRPCARHLLSVPYRLDSSYGGGLRTLRRTDRRDSCIQR